MKNKTKIKIILIILFAIIFILKFFWIGFFSNIFPWERTFFFCYKEYQLLLDDHGFYNRYGFIDEIPQGSSDVNYFVSRAFREKKTAHSIVLDKGIYQNSIDERSVPYVERCNGKSSVLIFQAKENEYWTLNDLQNAGIEIDCIKNVVQHPEAQEEYRCLVVIWIRTTHGTCHTGVIVNDNTHELIEFSVEIPDEG